MSARHLSDVRSNGAADNASQIGAPRKAVELVSSLREDSHAASGIACGGGFSITLPLPTSANRIWRRGKGGKTTHISAEYAAWKQDARAALQRMELPPVYGPYRLVIEVSERDRGDLDNRIKALSDLLVSLKLTSDDRNAWEISTRRNKQVHPRLCRVSVSPALPQRMGAAVAGGALDGVGESPIGSVNAAA